MDKSNGAGPKLVEIDLNKLTLPELSREKQQLDQVRKSIVCNYYLFSSRFVYYVREYAFDEKLTLELML